MKAPHTPTRFHASVRHYHRTRPTQSGGWETWVGNEMKRKSKKKKPLITTIAFLLLSAIAAATYFLI
jgi:hypothetical protein